MDYLLENIEKIKKRIKTTCEKVNRREEEIKILFVSKNATAQQMAFLYQNYFLPSQKNKKYYLYFGENRMPDAERRKKEFETLIENLSIKNQPFHFKKNLIEIQWHFIGYLQSNKLNKILNFSQMIQSIDRLEIAQKIHLKNLNNKEQRNILIQVNTSKEENKSGFTVEDTIEKIKFIADNYPSLKIKGLMTIAHQDQQEDKTRNCFQQLKTLYEESKNLKQKNIAMEILSMGMSNDLEIAIEEGSNMIRIGSDIFQKK